MSAAELVAAADRGPSDEEIAHLRCDLIDTAKSYAECGKELESATARATAAEESLKAAEARADAAEQRATAAEESAAAARAGVGADEGGSAGRETTIKAMRRVLGFDNKEEYSEVLVSVPVRQPVRYLPRGLRTPCERRRRSSG
jgi:hypothetical protein